MKKSIIFFIGIAMSVSLVFTSCLKDTEVVETKLGTNSELSEYQKIANTQGEIAVLIPEHVGQSPEDIEAFIAGLSKQEVYDRMLSYRVFRFLEVHQAIDALIADRPEFDILTQEDIKQYAPRVLDQFKNFEADAGFRACYVINSVCLKFALNEVVICYYGSIPVVFHRSTPKHPSCYDPHPCYPTGGTIDPNITNKYQCENVNALNWYQGACWLCY